MTSAGFSANGANGASNQGVTGVSRLLSEPAPGPGSRPPATPAAGSGRLPTVVIAGGGVAALEAMLALRELLEEAVRIEIVSPERDFVYRPLSVAEPFGRGRVHRFDLAALAAQRDATVHADAIAEVDTDRRRVTTGRDSEIAYDVLLVAIGARPREVLPGAITFWGPSDVGAMRILLREIERGDASEVAFAVPGGPGWVLPLYELALLTGTHISEHGVEGVELSLVTPEESPLEVFGARASAAVEAALAERGVGVLCEAYPSSIEGAALRLVPDRTVPAERVVTLPRLVGPAIVGLPADENGFLPADDHGRVRGSGGVYAAGDSTAFPIKQGGIAAQQADAAAEAIAAELGAPIEPQPFQPVLRGLLLTGGQPRFLRNVLPGGQGDASEAEREPLWWPPGKIAGRHLGPFLTERSGIDLQPRPEGAGAVRVDVDLSSPDPA